MNTQVRICGQRQMRRKMATADARPGEERFFPVTDLVLPPNDNNGNHVADEAAARLQFRDGGTRNGSDRANDFFDDSGERDRFAGRQLYQQLDGQSAGNGNAAPNQAAQAQTGQSQLAAAHRSDDVPSDTFGLAATGGFDSHAVALFDPRSVLNDVGGQLNDQSKAHQNIVVLNGKGVVANVDFRRYDREKAIEVANNLQAEGAIVLPHSASRETGYWNPAVRTDDQGKASFTFALPERFDRLASARQGRDRQNARRSGQRTAGGQERAVRRNQAAAGVCRWRQSEDRRYGSSSSVESGRRSK